MKYKGKYYVTPPKCKPKGTWETRLRRRGLFKDLDRNLQINTDELFEDFCPADQSCYDFECEVGAFGDPHLHSWDGKYSEFHGK